MTRKILLCPHRKRNLQATLRLLTFRTAQTALSRNPLESWRSGTVSPPVLESLQTNRIPLNWNVACAKPDIPMKSSMPGQRRHHDGRVAPPRLDSQKPAVDGDSRIGRKRRPEGTALVSHGIEFGENHRRVAASRRRGRAGGNAGFLRITALDYTKGFASLFEQLARDHSVTLIPFFLEGVAARKELNQADGIHPTAEGYRIVSQTVFDAIEPLLKKERPLSQPR